MKNKQKLVAIIALVLCLVSMIGTSLITSNFGKVDVINLSIKTEIGTLTGYLLVPEGATAKNPAPAVVVSHGASASAEFVDSWYDELARRGYIADKNVFHFFLIWFSFRYSWMGVAGKHNIYAIWNKQHCPLF